MGKRFSVEQIAGVLQQVAGGVPVGDVCRQVGALRAEVLPGDKEYGGRLPGEAREMKRLRDAGRCRLPSAECAATSRAPR